MTRPKSTRNSWAEPEYWRARPRRVEGGIQLATTRGPIARTWWSRRFLEVLENLGVGGRLARGRSYARQGQIVSFEVTAGAVTALVQGSAPTPYRVRIGVPAYGKAEWAEVLDALARDAWFTATLLGGEMPREIEDLFGACGLALFPATGRDLTMDCTCPDREVPCKHLAAAFYLLAERFDADPFTVLELRGRDRETLLADLRTRRAGPGTHKERPAALDSRLDTFFTAGPLDPLPAAPRTRSDVLLDQVPDLPLTVRGHRLVDLLRPAYRALGSDG